MSMTRTDLTGRRGRARRLVRPTLRGAVFLGLGAVLFAVAWVYDERDLLFVAGLLLLVSAAALGFVLVHPLRVAVTRTFRPGTVSAGLSAAVTIQIRNLAPAPMPGLRWRDLAARGVAVPPSQPLRTLAPGWAGRTAAGDTAVVSYHVHTTRRGVYPIGPLMLGRTDPFGLAYSEWPVGAPHDLTVTPRVTALPGNGVSITRGEGSRHERVRHLDNDSDELIAREYRPGDPMRRVNWPATARHGEIMVRQEEQRSHPEARLILDTTRGGHGADHDTEFEVAIELAASIAVHLLEGGFRLDVVELGPCQLVPGRSRPGDPKARHDPDDGRRGGLRGDEPASFTGPEGVLSLVDALANVVQRDRPARARGDDDVWDSGHRPAPALGRQIPGFAVLVDIGTGDTRDLAALRGLCQPAVAFVFDTVSAQALERLTDAGWQCVQVNAASGVAAAWAQAGLDRAETR
ncbi:DUF58 domain-containing protein [Cryobacterium sp. W22_MBD10_FK3]|uniref:DUF58 domain-containing protein n=1 Tax=Cryobacterium sp. W22_MBD10_FK3 TaxID=3240273 RepID=UPI003F931FF0